MSLRFHIDRDRGLVLGVADARLEDRDLLEAAEALPDQPGFRRGLRVVIDLSPVERLEVTAAGVRRAVDLAKHQPDDCAVRSCTIVAPADALYGLARMYQTLLNDRMAVAVTRTMREALALIEPPPASQDRSSAAS